MAAPGYSVLRERQNISEEESQLLLSPPQVQPLSPGSVQAPADLPEFDLLDPHQETGPARPMIVKPTTRRPPSLRRGSNCVSLDTTVSEFLNLQKNPTSRPSLWRGRRLQHKLSSTRGPRYLVFVAFFHTDDSTTVVIVWEIIK